MSTYISSNNLEVFSNLVSLTVQDNKPGYSKKQGKLETEVIRGRLKNGTRSSFLSWMGALKCCSFANVDFFLLSMKSEQCCQHTPEILREL